MVEGVTIDVGWELRGLDLLVLRDVGTVDARDVGSGQGVVSGVGSGLGDELEVVNVSLVVLLGVSSRDLRVEIGCLHVGKLGGFRGGHGSAVTDEGQGKSGAHVSAEVLVLLGKVSGVGSVKLGIDIDTVDHDIEADGGASVTLG